jgi:hypothetical protein
VDRDVHNPSADTYRLAKINARLGNTDEVFRLLDLAYQQRSGWMDVLLVDDCFDSLHRDPRFMRLVALVGFHPVSGAIN